MFEMTTRNFSSIDLVKDSCTDFVLHKSQQTCFTGIQKKIIDFTEHKLFHYAESVDDPQQKLVLMAMFSDYRKGLIAIAWKRGQPVYMNVQRDSLKSKNTTAK